MKMASDSTRTITVTCLELGVRLGVVSVVGSCELIGSSRYVRNLDLLYRHDVGPSRTSTHWYTGYVPPVTKEPRICSVARTLDVVGEKWALLAIREVFLGNRRFDEMVRHTGAPRDTLAARLRTLVNAEILERRQYSEHPVRFEYFLTEAGKDLYPVIVTLRQWGDRHLAGEHGPPARFEHRCGATLVADLVCEACGESLDRPFSRRVASESA
jgi:DNA-binding HxlR family transcriptional regulator